MSSQPSSPLISSPASTGAAPPNLAVFTRGYFRYSHSAFAIASFLVSKLRLAKSALLTALCYWHEFVSAHGLRKVNEVLLAATCVFLAAKVEHAHIRLARLVEYAFDLDQSTSGEEVERWCRAVLDVELVLCDTIHFDFVRIFPFANTLQSLQVLTTAGQLPEPALQSMSTAVWRIFLFSFVTPLCTKVLPQRLCTAILWMVVRNGYPEWIPMVRAVWEAPEAELPEEAELEGITGVLFDVFAYMRKKFGVPALDDANEARYKRRRTQLGTEGGAASSVFSSASTDFSPLVRLSEQ